MSYLSPEVLRAAEAHALAEYPKESCGLVVDGVYKRCGNYAVDPEKHFIIHPKDYAAAADRLQAVIHSHPDGPFFPTALDMRGQIDTAVPWAIITTDGERAGLSAIWGDQLPVAPIVGREFMHGVSDCYSLIRDTFRLGREALLEQDIVWPFDPILLPEVPRDDNWWAKTGDLYSEHFARFGFREIPMSQAKPGDVFLVKVRSDKLNHGGVLLGNEMIAHHLPTRLSRREPAGAWARAADLWIRHEASPHA